MQSPEYRVREVTKHVPFRAFATLFTVALTKLGRDGRPPKWLVSDGVGSYPRMELNVSSPFQRRMFYFPRAYWERLMGLPFGQYLASTLETGQVFLDVGANIGFYSLFAAQRVGPSGRVFSFEPDPMTFESLQRSVRRNGFGWASCLNMAVSDREGEMPFFQVSDGSAHSLVPEIERRAEHVPRRCRPSARARLCAAPVEKGRAAARPGRRHSGQGRRVVPTALTLPPKPRRKVRWRDMGRHGDPA